MKVSSFGFKHGVPDESKTLVIDVRRMQNPWFMPAFRPLTGTDPAIVKFVSNDPMFPLLISQGMVAAKRGQDVAYGCTGGKHRSVVLANALAAKLQAVGVCVTVEHTALVTA